MKAMATSLEQATVDALDHEPIDWKYKGLPSSWWGQTPAQVCRRRPSLFDDGAVSPVCTLRTQPLVHNMVTMARWCRRRGVQLAPHGKTHMAPQLLARQLGAGAVAVTAATISQVRVFRAFGVRRIILANELVDVAALRWLAAELDANPDFELTCWVDSVRGAALMTSALTGRRRQVDVCIEVGQQGGRTGCRDADTVDAVAHAVVASDRLRLIGVAGYEAATGHEISESAVAAVTAYLNTMRDTVLRLRPLFETDEILVTAGGSTYFDLVADVLTDWPDDMSVHTVLRSGCYLTHDDGLYARTTPLGRSDDGHLEPALSIWAQVLSRPEPDLAIVGMGRRDVSFDQDLPVPYGRPDSRVEKLNDQHAYLRLAPEDQRIEVGDWLEFGVSHPCTVFDKWQLIPVLDADHRVVELVRTFF
ncbi:amino acid deaminase [Mycobacterium sp. CBMA293]|nr:amino acid deaminase [Mycolicibacterium sp. CBMA 360]MUL58815.1 amino acid deaminase [Mycolicibacterium sp. CBMA 335]MUL69209.1 amino acid deaminase [Mycolicibacterium sp. CBMA 311]MUL94173.1 amino acid deaminase [Mycolicibacterium sp. CBMA 230]MUM11302.1 amino acid deaminase [Mycolicibacterium sp. CBMA 293]MUM32571.1 amino acid deaminase [Mycolicibacterium sp. CBMA 361]